MTRCSRSPTRWLPAIRASILGLCLAAALCSGAAAQSPLEQLLSLVPLECTNPEIWFTDWDGLKAATGFSWVDSSLPMDLRVAFALRLNQDLATAAAFGIEHLRGHEENWGFDFTDLSWEAAVLGRGLAPFCILKLRQGFDVSPLLAHFDARGFVQTESFGVTVYHKDLALGSDWIRTTELAIHNTAVIAEDGLLILSSSLGSVEAVLATRAGPLPSLEDHPFAASLLSHLQDPHTGVLLLDPSLCLRFASFDLLELLSSDDAASQLAEQFQSAGTLHPYFAFGLGVRFAIDQSTTQVASEGTFVMEYGDEDIAAGDLAAREALASSGTGRQSPNPMFALDDARVVDGAIIFHVSPLDQRPRNLLRMLMIADLPFAACD